MEQVSSSYFHSDSQKIPRILRFPKVHYRIHTSPSVGAVFNHINPVHALTSYFFETYFNIIVPSTSGSSQWPSSYFTPKLCMTFIFLCYSDKLVNVGEEHSQSLVSESLGSGEYTL